MTSRLSRRDFLGASARTGAGVGAAALLPPVTRLAAGLQPSGSTRRLRAGVGVADLTPELGKTFFGYVRPDRTADGVAIRLSGRALVLDDGATRLALLTVDLGASLDKAGVVQRIADLGYTMDTVVIAPTHTHAGPEEWTDWLEGQMAAAVRRADADLGPAVAGWARGQIGDVSTNRSLAAHLANHDLDVGVHEGDVSMDPDGPDHPRDLNIRLLRVERPSGQPVAGWGLFPVHPTNFPNTNTLYSADLSGFAVRRFQASFRSGPAPGSLDGGPGVPVGILANSNEGDLISLYESYNPHSSADLMGLRLGTKLRELWDAAGDVLTADVQLGRRWTRIRFQGQEVAPGKRVGRQALFGVPFLGGAENGPSPFYQGGTEGRRRPAAAADPVHGRKIVASPAPWQTDPELMVVRVGPTMLVAVPGEATTEAGRRINAAALAAAPDGVDDAAVLGLTNDYTGYYTTPEEYDRQHYEGGHTVFGKWSSLLVVDGGRRLADALANDEPAPPPEVDPAPEYPPQGGQGGGVGRGAGTGRVTAQPPCEVARMQTADFTWQGGDNSGHDRPVGTPFVVLERQRADGSWSPADSDLGLALQWTEEDGTYLARHEVARDWPLATHRFRVTAARYELLTEPFEVVASSTLIVRGVEARPGAATRLVFRAQNPPPDPVEHLRYREVVPAGGQLAFRYRDENHVARWNPTQDGWVAEVAGDTRGEVVELDDGALVDAAGNRSGAGATYRIGDVAELVWPPDMEVGGTGRDWHAHTASEADVGRGECAPPAGPSGSPHPQATPSRSSGPREGSASAADGAGAGTHPRGDADGGPLPATGAGAGVAGAATLGAAAMASRLAARRPRSDPRDDQDGP